MELNISFKILNAETLKTAPIIIMDITQPIIINISFSSKSNPSPLIGMSYFGQIFF